MIHLDGIFHEINYLFLGTLIDGTPPILDHVNLQHLFFPRIPDFSPVSTCRIRSVPAALVCPMLPGKPRKKRGRKKNGFSRWNKRSEGLATSGASGFFRWSLLWKSWESSPWTLEDPHLWIIFQANQSSDDWHWKISSGPWVNCLRYRNVFFGSCTFSHPNGQTFSSDWWFQICPYFAIC